MAKNFVTTVHFAGKSLEAIVLPTLRQNGMHYEVNIPGFPRFFMRWGVADRYEVLQENDLNLPPGFGLAVSDALESVTHR